MPVDFREGDRVRYIVPNRLVPVGMMGTFLCMREGWRDQVIIYFDEPTGRDHEHECYIMIDSVELVSKSMNPEDKTALELAIKELTDASH